MDFDEFAERKRAVYIKNKHGCEFLRFNPDDSDVFNNNVGKIINLILKRHLDIST